LSLALFGGFDVLRSTHNGPLIDGQASCRHLNATYTHITHHTACKYGSRL